MVDEVITRKGDLRRPISRFEGDAAGYSTEKVNIPGGIPDGVTVSAYGRQTSQVPAL